MISRSPISAVPISAPPAAVVFAPISWNGAADFPAVQVVGGFNVTPVFAGSVSLPAVQAAGTVGSGIFFNGAVKLPKLSSAGVIFGNSTWTGAVNFPAIKAAGSGITGIFWNGAAKLPKLKASGSAISGALWNGTAKLPALTASGAALTGQFWNGAAKFPALRAVGTLTGSILFAGAAKLPKLTAAGEALGGSDYSGAILFPAVAASGWWLGVTDEIFAAFVMNAATLGVGQYENYPMRSLFPLLINGRQVMFGISPAGLHRFAEHQDDAGEAITARFVSGVSNMGIDQRKWLTDAYIECRAPGGFTVSVTYDERETFVCTVDPDAGQNGLHFKRIKLPRGIDGTHIQLTVENQDGADFDLQSLRVITVPKTRRIG